MSAPEEEQPQAQVVMCGPSTVRCKCQCPDGPCEHKWDGPWEESPDGTTGTTTCSRCGAWGIDHDMWVGP